MPHIHPLRDSGPGAFDPSELNDLVSTCFEGGRSYLVESWGMLQPLRFSMLSGSTWCIMRQHPEAAIDDNSAAYPDAAYPWRVMPFAKARVQFTVYPHPIIVDIPTDDMRKWLSNTHIHNLITFCIDQKNAPFVRLSTAYLNEADDMRERQRRALDWVLNDRPKWHPLHREASVKG